MITPPSSRSTKRTWTRWPLQIEWPSHRWREWTESDSLCSVYVLCCRNAWECVERVDIRTYCSNARSQHERRTTASFERSPRNPSSYETPWWNGCVETDRVSCWESTWVSTRNVPWNPARSHKSTETWMDTSYGLVMLIEVSLDSPRVRTNLDVFDW